MAPTLMPIYSQQRYHTGEGKHQDMLRPSKGLPNKTSTRGVLLKDLQEALDSRRKSSQLTTASTASQRACHQKHMGDRAVPAERAVLSFASEKRREIASVGESA